MANATAIRVALVRKLLQGGHRLRVEHIVDRMTERELCSLLHELPVREACSIASLVLGPALAAHAALTSHPLPVVVAALSRVDPEWGADYLTHMPEEARDRVRRALPSEAAEALQQVEAHRHRRFRWPWKKPAAEHVAL